MLQRRIATKARHIYHYSLARLAAWWYGHPAESMVIIGVTGTNGKSSTTQFIAQILTELGERVGYTSTAGFSIAGVPYENRMKMTMPGRFTLQKLLFSMKQAGCTYAIVETSSQGLEQFRHVGIHYDIAVFTNLTPEHLEAHGGFEAYKLAKSKLFTHLMKFPRKTLFGREILRSSVVNEDSPYGAYYGSFPADAHWKFSFLPKKDVGSDARRIFAEYRTQSREGVDVVVGGYGVHWNLPATFSHLNALAAISAVTACGIPLEQVVKASEKLAPIAGRYEEIKQGQPFLVIVDYAYEPYALEALYAALPKDRSGRVIGVHGSAGGGRDRARRPKIGELAAKHEDIVIVTNEDPYDEPPEDIIREVAQGAERAGKVANKDLFTFLDRGEAIAHALRIAREGDVVLVTGKGSEPVMAVAGGKVIPWDDRKVVRDVLSSLGYDAA